MDYPRRGIDDDVILAWADASARLAAELRRTHTAPRPELTLCPPAAQCRHAAFVTAAAAALLYWPYTRLFHCACQWHLAFEIHPIFRLWHWGAAAGISVAWQLFDRTKKSPLGGSWLPQWLPLILVPSRHSGSDLVGRQGLEP